MLDTFYNIIKSQFPMLLEQRVAVALSGGLDSVSLVHLLHDAGIKLQMIHVNFNLRGAESDGDAHFVEKLAKKLDCPLYVKSVSAQDYATKHHISIQMAARELRYTYFNQLVSQGEVDYVLTAHHLDDQIETFLINLGRGTGLRGLTGIPAISGSIVRPLLSFSREDIMEYALSRKLTWREDSSNNSNKYVRNDLRNNVIPLLKESLPHLTQTFSETLNHLQESLTLSEQQIEQFLNKAVSTRAGLTRISIKALEQTKYPRAYLYELLKGNGFNINDALHLLQATSGKYVYGDGYRLIKDRYYLYLAPIEPKSPVNTIIDKFTAITTVDEKKLCMEFIETTDPMKTLKSLINDQVLLLDAAGVEFPLEIRNWQEGDVMKPLGLHGKKKVSDILIDNKISRLEKENCLVLKDKQDILWLVGLRTSSIHKITTSTQRILKIWFTD